MYNGEPFITFTGENSDFTLTATYKEWNGIVEYSTDKTTWIIWDGTAISSSNKKLYLRGSRNNTFYTSEGAKFVLSALAGCSGNINTLLEYSNPPTELSANNTYRHMFRECTNLTTAPELPATTLATYCYGYMFTHCTNLTTAPELPATTLADYCYNGMFYGCTKLTTAPELSATNLAYFCYDSMFSTCTNLTTAPELPATTLAVSCYNAMFANCTNLTKAPELTATTLANYCYYFMFSNCANLTIAPKLPATTLANNCYSYMFNKCTNLKISSSKTDYYQYEWRIPTSGTITSTATDWNLNMLKDTGGTFTSNPSINTIYYTDKSAVTHNINYTLNNCTGSSSNPTTIDDGESITLSFTPNTGYSFPNDIKVLGASYVWNKDTGNLVISNATEDVTIVINCSLSLFTITTNLFNCTSDVTNPTTIQYGTSATLQFTPNETYMFTNEISVTNAIYVWNKDTGILEISNPSNNVVITLSAVSDGKLWLYLYQNTSEVNRVDKTNYLTQVGTISGVFRESSSIINLGITIESTTIPNFNYVYIPMLNRYYFVNDITTVRNNLWEISCSVDPLMSYKEAILACTGFVDRNENEFNADLIDKKRVVEEGNTIEVATVTNELFTATQGTYLLNGILVSTYNKGS